MSTETSKNTLPKFHLDENEHLRFNPLLSEWVLVCPARLRRPWKGQVAPEPSTDIPEYDPNNPLSPEGPRPDGSRNPKYEKTYVFDNDFPALTPNNAPVPSDAEDPAAHPLLRKATARGKCRVMCFSPKSNVTLATMDVPSIRIVVDEWVNQFVSSQTLEIHFKYATNLSRSMRVFCVFLPQNELKQQFKWVQIFENRGDIMGCSNAHPHCQIWASEFLPDVPATKDRTQKSYYAQNGRPLLMDYVQLELERRDRIVVQTDHWLCVVPWWAAWPYETMLLPRKRQIIRINDLQDAERDDLASAMKQVLIKYDNLFETSFPYSMGWHGAPTGSECLQTDQSHWLLHAVYLPPLLRSASVKKHMVGYELLACSQRDLSAEQAARRLRELSGEVHYKSSDKR